MPSGLQHAKATSVPDVATELDTRRRSVCVLMCVSSNWKVVIYYPSLYFCMGMEHLRERDHLGDPGVDGRIILRCIFRSGMWGYGLDRAGSG
jgi:hypothetical protein